MADKPTRVRATVPASSVPYPAESGEKSKEVPAVGAVPAVGTTAPLTDSDPLGTNESVEAEQAGPLSDTKGGAATGNPAVQAGPTLGDGDAGELDDPADAKTGKPPFSVNPSARDAARAGVDPGRQGRCPTPITASSPDSGGSTNEPVTPREFAGTVTRFMQAVRGIDADGAATAAGVCMMTALAASPIPQRVRENFAAVLGVDDAEKTFAEFESFKGEESGRFHRFANPHQHRVGVHAGSQLGMAAHANTVKAGGLNPNDIAFLIDLVTRAIAWWRGRSSG